MIKPGILVRLLRWTLTKLSVRAITHIECCAHQELFDRVMAPFDEWESTDVEKD